MEPYTEKKRHPINFFKLILEKQRHLEFLHPDDEKEDARKFREMKKVCDSN